MDDETIGQRDPRSQVAVGDLVPPNSRFTSQESGGLRGVRKVSLQVWGARIKIASDL